MFRLHPMPINYVTELAHPGVEAIGESSGNAKQRGFVLVRAGGLFPQLQCCFWGPQELGGMGWLHLCGAEKRLLACTCGDALPSFTPSLLQRL